MQPTIYQICVRGRLTERTATALEEMVLQPAGADSVFVGDLGLELVSIVPLTERRPPVQSAV